MASTPERIHLNQTIPYLTARFCSLFSADEVPDGFDAKMREHIDLSVREAFYVQCVGMREPVPLMQLYQPTKLKLMPTITPTSQEDTALERILSCRENTIVFAGPGQGKTTFLKHVLFSQAYATEFVPLLFTLRSSGVLDLLAALNDIFDQRNRLHRVPPTGEKLLLLVDGLDEIGDEQRQHVARLLRRFEGLHAGYFILACRTGYSTHNLLAQELVLADFDREDAERFVDAFAGAMRLHISGSDLVQELESRQLTYIVTHPLMLTLACVVKSRINPQLPQNATELLRQAIETLSFRWDEARGVTHLTETGLLSIHVLECTMQVAYKMRGLKVSLTEVIGVIREYLGLLRRPDIFPEKVLDDVRRFFGFLIITPDGYCQFVHKTVHDYLAARFEVENGLFQPGRVQQWDMRAAYAACHMHNATQSLHMALVNSQSIEAVRECLINRARFDPGIVGVAVFMHYDKYRNYTHFITNESGFKILNVASPSDLFDVADDVLVTAILNKAPLLKRTTGAEVVVALCIVELHSRKAAISPEKWTSVRTVLPEVDTIRATRFGHTTELMLPPWLQGA